MNKEQHWVVIMVQNNALEPQNPLHFTFRQFYQDGDLVLVLRLLKGCSGTRHDDNCVSVATCFHRCPPVNLSMHLLTVCNYMDAVIMCCD